ncbi:hypothetical protein ABMA27_014003 [Loxostege sticticalis]|uniref:Transposase n=1 Tax=Loxostege sticticalis TaxID=481309 RepID=A0ABR3H4V6_LOXSC
MASRPPSPQPGPSNWDPLSAELSVMMSPQNIDLQDMSDLNFDVSDADLYGILAENMDDVIDDWVNENPEAEAAAYDEELPIDDENEPEAPNTWYPGNPSNMTNIPFTGTPGLVSPHNMDGKSCIDFFFLFFNVNFWNLIVECTNKCGNKLKTEANTSRARFAKWKDLTISELKVFIGIILFMGTIKLNRMADYWSTNYLMRLSPHLFMARDRFYLILRALNVQTDERPESIFKIKSLIDLFNQSMSSIYYPSKNIAIDESLILWKGRLSFRQYLKGKRHRYGIKLYILADMHGIILKIHLYAGSGDQLVGGRNHVKKVVNLLMEQYINKGHSLYIDNFYTSVGLAEELLNKNTYVTGTLRAKRAGNPNLIHNKLKAGESCIMHNQKKIVVTKWLDKREVLLLSSEHDSNYKMTTSRRIRSVKYKPAAQVEYNKYMRAIDKHDQLLSYYSCEHKTLRWYKKVIIHVIQTCLVNGYLLYRKINNSNIELYYFRKVILENLLQLPNVPVPARSLNERIHLPTPLPKRSGRISRKRCRICYKKTKKNNQVLYGCPDCPGFPGLCLTPCFREYHNY